MVQRRNISVGIFLLLAVSKPLLSQIKADAVKREVYESLEQMPEFPGGVVEMENFVIKNLRLPQIKEPEPKAGVYIRFIVNADGSVSDIKTARSSGNTAVDDSVKAVIGRMPLWKPGMLQGKPVNCYYNLPISHIRYQ